jgi:hypothetical protein
MFKNEIYGCDFFQYLFIFTTLDKIKIRHLKSATNEAAVLVCKNAGVRN